LALALLTDTLGRHHLEMAGEQIVSLPHRNGIYGDGSIATKSAVCPVGVGDRYTPNIWPDPNESMTKRWSVGDSLGVDVLSMGHCPLVGEYHSREVMQFPGVWSAHSVTDVGSGRPWTRV